MMKKVKGILNPNLKLSLSLPPGISFEKFLTQSGTFKDGDLLVNKNGVRIISQSEPELPQLIKPSENGNQLNLEDFDVIKVIGKGNGGIVQLVQHKWTQQFFALKVCVQMSSLTLHILFRLNLNSIVTRLVMRRVNEAFTAFLALQETHSSKAHVVVVQHRYQVIQMNIEESARKQIAKELKINQSSQCPYVVVCYKSFFVNGAISIILEYMDGGSLADFLKKVKSIPEPYLAAICKQVVKGLIYLHHKKHIIHRDLKPSNLLVNHRGEVKITDFGVSAIMTNTSGLASTFVGTYNYMSPERIVGSNYGSKSDIWSLGLVLLECATGQFPYSPPDQAEGWSSFFELMEQIVQQQPPCAPSDQYSSEFCSFVSACVQKDPKERKSAHELLAHPFLNKYDDLDIDLSSYFYNAGSPLTPL